MDAFLAIASKRDERRYAERPIPPEVVERVLDAGRLCGNSQNKQAWRFLVVEDAERRERLAGALYSPANVRGAALAIAITGRAFDAGRCSQNMMLAAWNEGVTSCPNGIRDAAAAAEALGLEEGELAIVLSLGFPASGRDAARRTAEGWSERADRKPLSELVTRL
ncbi:MAG: nitroreductase family protein [Thermoleophilia bacterium]|nr:nitroreductase family protein [Thermoleophilia bacterium]